MLTVLIASSADDYGWLHLIVTRAHRVNACHAFAADVTSCTVAKFMP